MTENKIFRIGPIRPPSEASSLLLQMTRGCTWNKCKFCQLYRGTQFKAYTVDSIKADIDKVAVYAQKAGECHQKDGTWNVDQLNDQLSQMGGEEQNCYYMVINWLMDGGETVFLQDGNTVVLSGGKLSEVLLYLRQVFPGIKRISSYGRAENLSKVSLEDLIELKEAGLDRIHSGYESGSDKVLQLINKGVTSKEQIVAGQKIKAAGIQLSVYFMPGIGGKAFSAENALGMANVVSQAQPDFVRIRTAAIKPGTELYNMYRQGEFLLCSDDEKVKEIRSFIENTTRVDTQVVSDHMINLLQGVKGSLRTDREKMLATIDEYLSMEDKGRKLFQLARRTGQVVNIKEMDRLSQGKTLQLEQLNASLKSEKQRDEQLNELIGRYI
ncbi:MAG: radical SAM protein [Anaerovoracaceae bacterium]